MTCGPVTPTRPASPARPGPPRCAGFWPRRPTRRSGTPTRAGPDEHEVITKGALAGLALNGLSGYHVGDPATEPPGPALVIGYGTPAGRSYRAAVAALGEFLHLAYSPG